MTTIAWDGRTLAGDSRVSDDNCVDVLTVKKVFKNKNLLAAFCGTAYDGAAMRHWLRTCGNDDYDVFSGEGFPKSVMSDDFEGLLVTPCGKATSVNASGVVIEVAEPGGITAIGSGKQAALAAMLAGADAKQAVAIAAKLDPYTGGKITALRLDERS